MIAERIAEWIGVLLPARSAFLAVMAALAPLASAQIGGGEITGVVADAQSAAVAGATVTATNTATGVARQTVTNDSGGYALADVFMGEWLRRLD